MLFNSWVFILGFLPLTLIGFAVAGRLGGPRAAIGLLITASLGFYAWWDWRYALLLVALMVANFALGTWQGRIQARRGQGDRLLLALGIALNLAVLCWFKYTDFILANVHALTGWPVPVLGLALPLGISFFVFQKIAYLVDSYRGRTRGYGFADYCLFVLFFPQLIAGPITHHSEVVPQFRDGGARLRSDDLAAGLTMFAIGLAKKVLLADNIAVYANQAFTFVHDGHAPGLFTAWTGALAYTLQLYFDFSGYSDMAIGLARLFGIRLPVNFDSPYQATSIIDFWRRWHMTLSRFLRDYLYIPLGGNRKGAARRHLNLFATMLLGGLWHGAGWTFVIWGALHGAYLGVNHAWRHALERHPTLARWLPRPAAQVATLLAVVVGWVFFRAPDVRDAASMLAGMCGLNGIGLPPRLAAIGHGLVQVTPVKLAALGWIAALGAIALLAPNSQRIMARSRPALEPTTDAGALAWRPNAGWAAAAGIAFAVCLLSLNRVSEFLYFQF